MNLELIIQLVHFPQIPSGHVLMQTALGTALGQWPENGAVASLQVEGDPDEPLPTLWLPDCTQAQGDDQEQHKS